MGESHVSSQAGYLAELYQGTPASQKTANSRCEDQTLPKVEIL